MKHPGTAGLMPVQGTTCGLRPDLDKIGNETGFDFSQAVQFLPKEESSDYSTESQPEAEPVVRSNKPT